MNMENLPAALNAARKQLKPPSLRKNNKRLNAKTNQPQDLEGVLKKVIKAKATDASASASSNNNNNSKWAAASSSSINNSTFT